MGDAAEGIVEFIGNSPLWSEDSEVLAMSPLTDVNLVCPSSRSQTLFGNASFLGNSVPFKDRRPREQSSPEGDVPKPEFGHESVVNGQNV